MHKKAVISFFLIFFSLFVKAESLNLAEVYEIALKKDPELKIAEATFKDEKEAKAKGIAGLYLVLLQEELQVGMNLKCYVARNLRFLMALEIIPMDILLI